MCVCVEERCNLPARSLDGDGGKRERQCEKTKTRREKKRGPLALPSTTARNAAMVCIRPATMEDLLAMQRCNLLCLPENYQLKVRRRGRGDGSVDLW